MGPRVRWALVLVGLAAACDSSPAGPRPDARLTDGAPASDRDGLVLPPDTQPGPCIGDGKPGRYSEQAIQSGGQERKFFLYVPSSYDCRRPAPLMIHFHGTVGSKPGGTVKPEETWTLEPSVTVAEQKGFILARLRSLSREQSGLRVWQWRNNNEGDVNAVFTKDLLAHLGQHYNLDPRRRYASGFSNGTNMSMRFLRTGEVEFAGFGLVGGGIWGTNAQGFTPKLTAASAPHIYAVTGYRDYQWDTLVELLEALSLASYPQERIFQRFVDAGHELYGWHFAEMFDWMDAGKRPAKGTLGAGWTRDASFSSQANLLSLGLAPDGSLLVGGSDGALYRRSGAAWKTLGPVESAGGRRPALADLCILPSGLGIAVGEGEAVLTTDGGASWKMGKQVPDFFGTQLSGFPYSYLLGVSCQKITIVGGGYWAGASSTDGGMVWSAQAFTYSDGPALVAAVWLGASGTLLAAGYPNFLGRGTVGSTVAALSLPVQVGWLNDIAGPGGGQVWVVGEGGTVLHSGDDGQTWSKQTSSTTEDLYAVSFYDQKIGLAVGVHGAAVLTVDGGATWTSVPTGLDAYLGDVLWTDNTTAVVVGEAGAMLGFHR
jgi:predicted esterase